MPAYVAPTRLDDALETLGSGRYVVVAGATDHYPARVGRAWDEDILDVSRVKDLGAFGRVDDGWWIPATTTWTDVRTADLPPLFDGLREAAATIGGVQIQNRGTVVGNVANASPAADGMPSLMALDAEVELASVHGRRRVPVGDFVTGNRLTVRAADELVTGIHVPAVDGEARSGFEKLGARTSLVISIAMAAGVLVRDEDGRIGDARIAVGACSPVARRLTSLEARLRGRPCGRGPRRSTGRGRPRRARTDRRYPGHVRLPPRCGAHARTPSARATPGMTATSTAAPIALRVNGRDVAVDAPPMRRLSEVLRDELGLTGTKVGCDAGDCGACTVRLDGIAVCACLVPVAQAGGREVATIEGLASDDGALDPLQSAFLAHGAAQCGACIPGMLMTAATIPVEARHDDALVEDVLGGVLCRCTGYRAIRAAVAASADGSMPAMIAEPAAGRAVGARVSRLDGRARVDGSERYAADRAPDGALVLLVIRSPHAHARFRLGDLDAWVAARPGIVRALTAADLPGERTFGIYETGKDQPVLADGVVRHIGEPVLALVGEPDAIAAVVEEELPISWEQLAPIDVTAALAPGAAAIHAERPDNVLVRGRVARGDVDDALAGSAVVVDGELRTSFVEHAYIETEAGWARRVGDRLEVGATTQTPYMDRDEVARIVGLRPDQVRIIPSACGGGFGGKLDVSIQPLLAVAAWLLDRPVRGAYTRPESMRASTKRHPATIDASIGADADGRLTALRFHADFDTGAYASWGPTVASRVPIHATGPYVVPAVLATTRAIHTTGPVAGAFRGFGVPQAAAATEPLLDELAERLGLDPLELRLRNALRAGDQTATGQVLTASAGLARCLEALRPRWDALRAEAAAATRAPGPAPARGRARGALVRHRQHGAAEPVDRADGCPPRRVVRPALGRRRHRPGLHDGPRPDRGRRPRRAALERRGRERRHRPHARCRQDVGLAPDVRLRQRGARGRRRTCDAGS